MSEINVPHLIIYFDADLHAQDGCGWCIDPTPGGMTYRFSTFEDLVFNGIATCTMHDFIHPTPIS